MKPYMPGPASGAKVRKDGEVWTLVLVRDLRHTPELVWDALTDPAQLEQWAPFQADRNLASAGVVRLAPAGAPEGMHATETTIQRAEAPKLLEYNWGGNDLRWELELLANGGTRLTLWHNIDRRYIAMGAAGWHICFDVMDALLSGAPIGRIAGQQAMQFEGWQRLRAEYTKQLEMENE